jgi:serine/threonine protein kinase
MLLQLGLLDGDGFDFEDEYTVAVDIWSLGEIVFRALTGERPFPRSLGAYIKRNSPFPVDVLLACGVSQEGCNFLKCLMAPMPEDRLTAKDALSHIWIEPQKPSSGRASAEMQRYLI